MTFCKTSISHAWESQLEQQNPKYILSVQGIVPRKFFMVTYSRHVFNLETVTCCDLGLSFGGESLAREVSVNTLLACRSSQSRKHEIDTVPKRRWLSGTLNLATKYFYFWLHFQASGLHTCVFCLFVVVVLFVCFLFCFFCSLCPHAPPWNRMQCINYAQTEKLMSPAKILRAHFFDKISK